MVVDVTPENAYISTAAQCTCTSCGILGRCCTLLIVPMCKNEVSNPLYMSLPLTSWCYPYHNPRTAVQLI